VTAVRTARAERKRGETLEHAIHDAVLAELAEVGYAALTIEAVATRAKTGKASIYRRWDTKQNLVLDAFIARFGAPDDLLSSLLVDTDATTRDLLLTWAAGIVRISDEAGELIRAVVGEATRDPDLAVAVEQQVRRPKHAVLVDLLRRGVDRGEVHPDALSDLYADILPALLTYRMVLNNQPVTDHEAVEIIDRVVMPLISPH
jgi:AcrR family transcriptional regulator